MKLGGRHELRPAPVGGARLANVTIVRLMIEP